MFTKSGTLICRNEFRRGLFGNASRHTTHISEKCGIAESLKCNIKTACDLHFRVLAETRNYREITILGIRYLRWHTGELSSPFPVTPRFPLTVVVFRAFQSCNKNGSRKLLQSASRASCASVSAVPINKFPRGDFRVVHCTCAVLR